MEAGIDGVRSLGQQAYQQTGVLRMAHVLHFP
jgi:hypothetical protein